MGHNATAGGVAWLDIAEPIRRTPPKPIAFQFAIVALLSITSLRGCLQSSGWLCERTRTGGCPASAGRSGPAGQVLQCFRVLSEMCAVASLSVSAICERADRALQNPMRRGCTMRPCGAGWRQRLGALQATACQRSRLSSAKLAPSCKLRGGANLTRLAPKPRRSGLTCCFGGRVADRAGD
jgi:hypothetical protein